MDTEKYEESLKALRYGEREDVGTVAAFGPATAAEFSDGLKGCAVKAKARMRKNLRRSAIRLAKREKGARLTADEMKAVMGALEEVISTQAAL